MPSSEEIHEGIHTTQRTPPELLDLLLDGGRDGGVSNVGVDLDLEHAADDLGLELVVLLVRADDGTSWGVVEFTRDFVRRRSLHGNIEMTNEPTHEPTAAFECIRVKLTPGNLVPDELGPHPLALGHDQHLLCDDSPPGELHLGVPLELSLVNLDPLLI